MEKKTIYIALLALSLVGFVATIFLLSYSSYPEDITIPCMFLAVSFAGIITSVIILDDFDKNTPVSIKELKKLDYFSKEKDDSFSDWYSFSIIPTKKGEIITRWRFCLFDETDGKTYFVRYVDNMQQLKDVYKGITDKELK